MRNIRGYTERTAKEEKGPHEEGKAREVVWVGVLNWVKRSRGKNITAIRVARGLWNNMDVVFSLNGCPA